MTRSLFSWRAPLAALAAIAAASFAYARDILVESRPELKPTAAHHFGHEPSGTIRPVDNQLGLIPTMPSVVHSPTNHRTAWWRQFASKATAHLSHMIRVGPGTWSVRYVRTLRRHTSEGGALVPA